MNAIQKAACEALEFLFSSTNSKFTKQRILILQGPPSNYLAAFTDCKIDVINYDAAQRRHWEYKKANTSQPSGSYDVVIQFAAKSENETKLHLSIALEHTSPDSLYIGIAHNKMGSSRFQKHLSQIFPHVESMSKSKCKVLYSTVSTDTQKPNYSYLAKPSQVGKSDYLSLPGVYGEKSIDKGSALLATYLKKEHWSGIGADIGCGFGYLSGEILKTKHKVKQLWLYDSDSRAIQMAKLNLKGQADLQPHWCDVTEEIPTERQVHWAVMNPPFHSGAAQDFALGQKFIAQASSILRPGSPLFMVANLHLPYEDTLFEHFRSVVKLEEREGFKCFKAVK